MIPPSLRLFGAWRSGLKKIAASSGRSISSRRRFHECHLNRDRVADRRDGAHRIRAIGLRLVDAAHPGLGSVALFLVEAFAVALHKSSTAPAAGLPSRLRTVPVTKHGMPGAPSAMLPPWPNSGASGMWKEPSTDSVRSPPSAGSLARSYTCYAWHCSIPWNRDSTVLMRQLACARRSFPNSRPFRPRTTDSGHNQRS